MDEAEQTYNPTEHLPADDELEVDETEEEVDDDEVSDDGDEAGDDQEEADGDSNPPQANTSAASSSTKPGPFPADFDTVNKINRRFDELEAQRRLEQARQEQMDREKEKQEILKNWPELIDTTSPEETQSRANGRPSGKAEPAVRVPRTLTPSRPRFDANASLPPSPPNPALNPASSDVGPVLGRVFDASYKVMDWTEIVWDQLRNNIGLPEAGVIALLTLTPSVIEKALGVDLSGLEQVEAQVGSYLFLLYIALPFLRRQANERGLVHFDEASYARNYDNRLILAMLLIFAKELGPETMSGLADGIKFLAEGGWYLGKGAVNLAGDAVGLAGAAVREVKEEVPKFVREEIEPRLKVIAEFLDQHFPMIKKVFLGALGLGSAGMAAWKAAQVHEPEIKALSNPAGLASLAA